MRRPRRTAPTRKPSVPSARLALAWLVALSGGLTTARVFAQADFAPDLPEAGLPQHGLPPEPPLPVQPIAPALAYLPYLYLRVSDAGAPLYPSLEEALAGINVLRTIEPGYVFLSWIDRFEGEA